MSQGPQIRRSLAAAAVLAVLALPAPLAAQSDPVQAATELLGLTDVETRTRGDRVRGIRGTLPGGARVEVDFDREGQIREVEARGPDRFPLAAVETLVPEAVRGNASYPAGAVLDELAIEGDGRIDMEGFLADGREFDAEFTAAGELIELDIDD